MVGDVGPNDDPLGLESKSESMEKHVFIDCARMEVLSEQERQRQVEQDVDHPQQLATLYAQASEESCNRAHLRAVGVHAQLNAMKRNKNFGQRRRSMDITTGRSSTNEMLLESQGSSVRRNIANAIMPTIQSPCHQRWSQGSKNNNKNRDTMKAGLGMPIRSLRTPQQYDHVVELARLPQAIVAPVL